MAVKIRTSSGVVIDCSDFQFPMSITTPTPNKDDISVQPVENYRLKRELFEVYTPFYLDSQAQRILRESAEDSKPDESQASQDIARETPIHRETSAQRKRRKKKRPVLSDEEERVSKFLESVCSDLTSQGKEIGLFLEPRTDFLLTHENNKASRISALNFGCGDLFQELCSQEMGEHVNFGGKGVLALHEMPKNLTASSLIHNCVENSGKDGAQIVVVGHRFLIPPCSKFLMSSFSTLVSDLIGSITVPGGYDLIVMDPPWSNRSVKRKKSYQTFDESELCSLPLQSLSKVGGLVCVWVTNNARLESYVKDSVFPTWSVAWISDWYWMKVTKCGEPICDVHSSHKKPYEKLLIGRHKGTIIDPATDNLKDVQTDDENVQKTASSNSGGESFQSARESQIPKDYVIASVPCSLHSKKPFLSDVLSSYVPPQPKCLEMFARNLMPHWISWGNEVLRHQHTDYYETET